MTLPNILRFPNPVDDVSVRITAGVMAVLCWVQVGIRSEWLMGCVALSFLLRLAFGPRVDPVAFAVTRFARPRLRVAARLTPGPPKRFAQLIGTLLTAGAFLAGLGGATLAETVIAGIVATFATVESVFGFCAGCQVFALLMRANLIPQSVCQECADLSVRWKPRANPSA